MLFLILVTVESKGWKFLFCYESREVHKNKAKQKKMLIKFKRTKQKSLEGMSITWGSQTPQNKENI